MSILQNEKYKGDAILQKSFTVDFLTKKKKINEEEIPQYYVENSHPAIITPEVFDLVQHEIKKRKKARGHKTSLGCFSGKIVCGQCGSFYGSKVWHSNSKHRRVVWQCNAKFKNREKCTTSHIYEDKLKEAFVEVFNSIINNKEEILKSYEDIISGLMDTTKLDKESSRLQSEMDVVTEMLRKCVEENATIVMNQEEYEERYNSLVERYEDIKKKLGDIDEKRSDKNVKHKSILAYIRELENIDGVITEFDEDLWNGTIDRVIANEDKKVRFIFKDGMEIDWSVSVKN